MVKAAYSSGKPALGVGQGNVQCIVDDDVDLAEAAEKIITGRSFDNGLICLGEQCVFVPKNKYTVFVEEMKKQGAFYIDAPRPWIQLRKGAVPGRRFQPRCGRPQCRRCGGRCWNQGRSCGCPRTGRAGSGYRLRRCAVP
ncbi:MAG: aldehyde dehydrogenase family protein [Oscillospiraceae bacterium]